jgi:hypothetical protein
LLGIFRSKDIFKSLISILFFFSKKKDSKNAAAGEKIAKNQFITLKEINSSAHGGLKHDFFFNASFIDFLYAFFLRRKIFPQKRPIYIENGVIISGVSLFLYDK